MDKSIYVKHKAPSQRYNVDRFVLPRESVVELRRRRSWHAGCHDADTVDIWNPKHQKQVNYKGYLDKAFGLKPVNQRQHSTEDSRLKTWPCVPRKKRFLALADCILDLPTYNFIAFPDLLDWSRKDILVAALGPSYHMFGWHEQCVIGQGIAQHHIHSCKFGPRGEFLLLGTESQGIEMHDGVLYKMIDKRRCMCDIDDGVVCAVTALDWSPTGNSYVTGCSKGSIRSFALAGSIIAKWPGLVGAPILSVRVSPDTRFVAVAAFRASTVHLLVWPYLKYHSSLCCDWFHVKTLTWHSWRSALLGVGADVSDFEPRIALWDAPSSKIRATSLGGSPRSLDTMLFSHRTGELVLSLWNTGETLTQPANASTLVVMSDPHTVVDQSDGKNIMDRVRTMVFNPDGTKLATATEAEDLMIWNFLPEDKSKKNLDKSRTFYAIPSYIDEVTSGFVIR